MFTQAEFDYLLAIWVRDTKQSTDILEILSHPAYQHIVAKGEQTLPYILVDLQHNKRWWFTALSQITGIQPNIVAYYDLRKWWLRWAYENRKTLIAQRG